MFTKTVIILSFGVRVGPISTQTARGEHANPENTPGLCQEARSALKFLVLYRGDIVSTYILTDARNALLFLAFTRMSYSMPSGENKENKAYSRWIFFNLRPNEIARIIEHLQKGTFVPTWGANVYKEHNLSNFLQKEVPMGSETCLKNSDD